MMHLRPYQGIYPEIEEPVFIDPSAVVIGQVHIAAHASVWPHAVLRGDVNDIHIGAWTSIQDLSVLHVSHERTGFPGSGASLRVGERVTIGHQVCLHGCTIGDEVLVGMGSIVLDHAVIEPHVIIGAGSLVPKHKILEEGFLYLGRPAQKNRPLTEEERVFFRYSAEHYWRLSQEHMRSLNLCT